MQKGMYVPLRRSFLNLSASRCLSIYNLLWFAAKERFWSILHSDYAEMLDWHLRAKGDFERYDVCDFVMNVVLYDHSRYLRRVDKGMKLSHDKFGEMLRTMKFNKRIADFFKKLFKKNDSSEKKNV